jgi:DNA polymerase-1
MRYQIFTDEVQDSYDIAILIKPTSFDKDSLIKFYIKEFEFLGIDPSRIIAYTLEYTGGKVTAAHAKEYLKELVPVLEDLQVKYLYCADAAYFKLLSKQKKAEVHLGYQFPVPDTDMVVTLGINHSSIKYHPENLYKLRLSVKTLKDIMDENFNELGATIIHDSCYPDNYNDIRDHLNYLHSYPSLTCDIEAYSLSFNEAGIATIAFAPNKNQGIAFAVDYATGHEPNLPIRKLLKEFFDAYQGNMKYHNAGYDAKVLIYNLYMKDLLDVEGTLTGIETIARDIDDTQIVAYLATNSAHKPPLNLKYLAHEFTGNYAEEDIKDVRKIPLPQLLKYNLIDCLATWFVYDKHMPEVIETNQVECYEGIMLDSLRLLLQTELSGMPICLEQVKVVKEILQNTVDTSFKVFDRFDEIKEAEENLRAYALEKANQKLKVKVHTIDMEKYQKMKFNPNSGPQLQELLFNVMGLPVLSLTDTGQPSTGGDEIEVLLNHCTEKQKPLLQAILDFMGVAKILSSFIPAFEAALDKGHTVHYLHGSFKIGGTVSGRLSSSNPNMQNIPSGSMYGKLIKECFRAPPGYIFCGADFASLEDRINALLTKDTNKLKVYTDNYDGHCLRAFSYWPELFPEVRQVTNERTFEVDGQRFTETDTIDYEGKTYTGLEFYETYIC